MMPPEVVDSPIAVILMFFSLLAAPRHHFDGLLRPYGSSPAPRARLTASACLATVAADGGGRLARRRVPPIGGTAMRTTISILPLLAAAACSTPPGMSVPPPPVVQIEVPDYVSDLPAAMSGLGLSPSLRVGIDVSGIGARDPETAAAISEALEHGVELYSLSDGQRVDIAVQRSDDFEIVGLDGAVGRDFSRMASGLNVVPSAPLGDGWYMLAVDLSGAFAAGLPPDDFGASFGNVRYGSWLVARFSLAEQPFFRSISVNQPTGDSAGSDVCSFAIRTTAQVDAPQDVAVLFDGAAAPCGGDRQTRDGRALRGIACDMPATDTTVTLTVPSTLPSPAGPAIAPVSFAFPLDPSALPTDFRVSPWGGSAAGGSLEYAPLEELGLALLDAR